MNDKNIDKDLMTIRDLQEIKITLKSFSQSSIDQLQLLRETLAQIVTQEASVNKKIDEVDFLLKGFKKTIEENEKNFRALNKMLENIENKTIDRNNKEAIIITVEKLKKTTEDIDSIMKSMNVFLSENKIGIREIEDEIKKIEKGVGDMLTQVEKTLDTKKNLSWWVDWIYKVLLTIGIIYGFFIK